MHSIADRNRILRACWKDARFIVPDPLPEGHHFPVTVWGVIKDPHLRDQAFQDVVSWWPALKRWTVTHQCRADEEVTDYPCEVTFWQPLPPLPWD